MPLESQFADSANRLLKLELTDGVTTCYGIEYSPIPSLTASLQVGYKISVQNVQVVNGLWLLNASNTVFLGGHSSRVSCKQNDNTNLSFQLHFELLSPVALGLHVHFELILAFQKVVRREFNDPLNRVQFNLHDRRLSVLHLLHRARVLLL